MTASLPDQSSLREFSDEEQAELAELLDRYLMGWESGDPPSVAELVKDCPELEDAIRGYVEQLMELQDALHPKAQESQSPRKSEALRPREKPLGTHGEQTRLGDYHLLAEIGRGGMGIVYRARQLSLGRDVAIKTLPFASVLDPKQIKRFQNEAQAAGQLHHPNIVPVYAVGCERGVHYYSMQLIEGLSLEQVVNDLRDGGSGNDVRHQTTLVQPVDSEENRKQRASAPTATESKPSAETKFGDLSTIRETIHTRSHIASIVGLGVQAAEALHYAHQCGVIHRDIKPSNLMIDGRGNLWITDFGLARCQQTTPMSVTGDLMGTLRYMSPEQASGRVHAVDHRTDTYALGVTLYELLTLQFAFDAPNRIELITLINQTSPVSPRKLNPAIPADLETILCKAISHEPLERYESAGEFAEDLKRFSRGEPPLAKRPTYLDRTVKWVSRHQYLFLAVAATLLLIIGGLSLATFKISRHQQLEKQANERADLHLAQTNRVVQNFGTLVVDRLDDLSDGDDVRRELLGELKHYYQDFIQYANGQDDLADQLGNAHLRLADVYYQSENWNSSRENYELAIEILQSLPTAPNATPAIAAEKAHRLADAHGKIAAMQADHFGNEEWRVNLNHAIRLQGEAADLSVNELNSIELAGLLIQQGDYLLREDDDDQAVVSMEQAIAILDHQSPRVANQSEAQIRRLELDTICKNNLVSIVQTSNAELASTLMEDAVRSAETLVQARPSIFRHRIHLARVMANSASLAMETGDAATVETQLSTAIEHWKIISRRFPEESEHALALAANQNSLGQFFMSKRRWDHASIRFLDALETLHSLDETSQTTASVLSDLASVQNNLGLCYEKLDRMDNADLWYARSIQSQTQALIKDPENARYQDRLVLHQRNRERLHTGAIASAKSAE